MSETTKTPDDETLRAMLADFATATAKRPPCEAGLDPDACDACIAFTTESLEAGVRLWGQSRAPGTIKAIAAEVLRLRGLHEDALAAHERLAIRAWDAVQGDHHEPPASEDALVEGIERLRAERDAARETARALGASLAATRADFHAMEEVYYAAQASADALRAVIEGRTTPPTPEEVETHHAAGGAWLTVHPCSAGHTAMIRQRDVLLFVGGAIACIALDARRRPCAWPEVAR
jgi:hypothetical protein